MEMKQVVVRLNLTLLLLFFLTACVSTTESRSKSVVVEQRNGDITVLRNGDIQVKETWDVRFTQGSFQKAFRTIPLKSGSSISGWQVSEGREIYRRSDTRRARTFTIRMTTAKPLLPGFFPEQPTRSAPSHFSTRFPVRCASPPRVTNFI